jgi:hypothetical protein
MARVEVERDARERGDAVLGSPGLLASCGGPLSLVSTPSTDPDLGSNLCSDVCSGVCSGIISGVIAHRPHLTHVGSRGASTECTIISRISLSPADSLLLATAPVSTRPSLRLSAPVRRFSTSREARSLRTAMQRAVDVAFRLPAVPAVDGAAVWRAGAISPPPAAGAAKPLVANGVCARRVVVGRLGVMRLAIDPPARSLPDIACGGVRASHVWT